MSEKEVSQGDGTARLIALVEQWRSNAQTVRADRWCNTNDAPIWRSIHAHRADEIEKCADELEAVLRDAALTEDRETAIRQQAFMEAQRAVVEACQACDGQGWTVGIETGQGHDCDGTDAVCQQRCPVPIPVQVQEPCEYCGRPVEAIAAVLRDAAAPPRQQEENESDTRQSSASEAPDMEISASAKEKAPSNG